MDDKLYAKYESAKANHLELRKKMDYYTEQVRLTYAAYAEAEQLVSTYEEMLRDTDRS